MIPRKCSSPFIPTVVNGFNVLPMLMWPDGVPECPAWFDVQERCAAREDLPLSCSAAEELANVVLRDIPVSWNGFLAQEGVGGIYIFHRTLFTYEPRDPDHPINDKCIVLRLNTRELIVAQHVPPHECLRHTCAFVTIQPPPPVI